MKNDEKFDLRLMCDLDSSEKYTLCKWNLHHFLTTVDRTVSE